MAFTTEDITRGFETRYIEHLKAKLNKDMTDAAEPFVQEAIKEVEAAMRKSLASNLIAMIDGSLSCERLGSDLRILIKRPEEIVRDERGQIYRRPMT
jgi:hypothetical protein